jgi:hypothetical protein
MMQVLGFGSMNGLLFLPRVRDDRWFPPPELHKEALLSLDEELHAKKMEDIRNLKVPPPLGMQQEPTAPHQPDDEEEEEEEDVEADGDVNDDGEVDGDAEAEADGDLIGEIDSEEVGEDSRIEMSGEFDASGDLVEDQEGTSGLDDEDTSIGS